MNTTTRLLIMTLGNFIIVSIMLARASSIGIDLNNSTLIDNASNLSFMFDFVSFLVVLFFFNALILLMPSNRNAALRKIITILESKEQPMTHQYGRNRKQHV